MTELERVKRTLDQLRKLHDHDVDYELLTFWRVRRDTLEAAKKEATPSDPPLPAGFTEGQVDHRVLQRFVTCENRIAILEQMIRCTNKGMDRMTVHVEKLQAADVATEEAKEPEKPNLADRLFHHGQLQLELGERVGRLMDRVDAIEKRARETIGTMALLKAWNETRHILNIRRDHNEAIVHMDAAISAVTNSTEGEKCTDAIPTKS